ncbi:MAG TPA: isocitrate/isopropylmalate dehydrogenase family protein [Thermodesulfobacteriota bacterium]|nr:isocitrate/isopropylmalate dehydrogenase family protein [Thermodesulfobacteriota bacterium]
MKSYRIIVIPGDGIGPEIVDAALAVLDKTQELAGDFRLSYDFRQAGAAYYQEHGENISAETLEAIRQADATIKGPVGLKGVRRPDGTEAGVLGGILRIGFDLYANIRPIKLLPKVATPLKNRAPESIDYVIVRENTEGLYASRGRGLVMEQAATDTLLLTRKGCERICHFAFDLALRKTKGAPEDGRRRVTLVEKSNVLRSFHFFREIFAQIAQQYPGVEAESLYVDAASAALVMRPEHFQVIVTENMFGDILSDLGGATIGGLGMCPSSNVGEERAYFEPIHGSAPDLIGKNRANPLSQILAGGMMLDYLGRKKEAALLDQAVWRALEKDLFYISPSGQVEGGAKRVTAALQEELERCYREGK